MADNLDLDAARAFVAVAKAGSFRQAARTLGVPLSTLSDRVAALERNLGVALLVRTTRKLALTEAGRTFHTEAGRALALLQEASVRVSSLREQPSGSLRLTAPADFACTELTAAIAAYRARYPDVEVKTHLTNRFVDLIAEEYDIAIRGGHLADSGLIAKRVGSGSLVLVASHAYLATSPAMRHPRDLARHTCIGFHNEERDNQEVVWRLQTSGTLRFDVHPELAVTSTSMAMVIEHVRQGLGVALLPWHLVGDDLRRETVVRVLPQWAVAPVPVHIVYPALRVPSLKVQYMVEMLHSRLQALMTASCGAHCKDDDR